MAHNICNLDLLDYKLKYHGLLYGVFKLITFILFIKPPQLVRDFVENYFILDLTDEAVKEICQLEHPKIMLVQLNPETIFTAK